MTLLYNIKPFEYDLVFTQGDTINFSLDVFLNDVAYDLTGKDVDIHFKRLDGLLVKSCTSAGGSPEITILSNNFTIYTQGFSSGKETLNYDVQVTDGSDILTIGKGRVSVLKEYTT